MLHWNYSVRELANEQIGELANEGIVLYLKIGGFWKNGFHMLRGKFLQPCLPARLQA